MAILKSPPEHPKSATIQVRLEEETRHNLDKYAEFIDGNASYVVSEALKLLNVLKHNEGQSPVWGDTGRDARTLQQFRRLLGRTDESDQKLLVFVAQKMASQKKVRAKA